jgi:hypothetical protein
LRRITLIILMAGLFVLAKGAAVSAGGAVFGLTDEDGDRVRRGEQSVQPGQILTAHTSFSPQIAGLGGIDDGPYVVYLLRGSRYVHPGSVPPTAIDLRQLEIVQGRRFGTVARITFTVPNVPTGDYTMSLCNDPCAVDGLGDIVGGWLRITQTTKEGRLSRGSTRCNGTVPRRITRCGRPRSGSRGSSPAPMTRRGRSRTCEAGSRTSRRRFVRAEECLLGRDR